VGELKTYLPELLLTRGRIARIQSDVGPSRCRPSGITYPEITENAGRAPTIFEAVVLVAQEGASR